METIKNVHLLQILEGIKKIENLKLGGVKTKVVLKNKKALIAAYEELIEERGNENYNNYIVSSFDEIKKKLNDKIEYNKEVDALYEKTNDELRAIRTELESAYKELDITKTELQLYKNDFILKSSTF